MLRRAGLVIIFILFVAAMFAQPDSLKVTTPLDSLDTNPIQVSKAEILQWIDEHRELPFVAPASLVPLQHEAGDLYRSGWLYLGRPDLPIAKVMGFNHQGGAFNPSLYHGYYLSFYPKMRSLNQGYEPEIYPYEPALSYINGGIGEYEHHYARAGLMKNQLFGIANCYYQGDLLAQNGFWTDINSAETSHKHYFSIPVKNFSLSAEYANWNKDVAMTELLPVYWQNTNFMITHRMNHVYASIMHPWGEVALMHTEEKASAPVFSKMLESTSTQIRLMKSHDHGTWKYLAAYEHAIHKASVPSMENGGQDGYKDKLSFNWDSYPYVGLELDMQLLDWKRGRINSEVLIPVGGSYLGAYLRMKTGEEDYEEQVDDIYNAGACLDMMNLDTRREQAGFVRYEYEGISTLLAVGSQQVKQIAGDTYLSYDQEQPFVRLGMDVDKSWGKWQLKAEPRWSWHKPVDNLCESPDYRFQSVQNLIYHLPWGNTLLAGFAAYGHSGYNIASLSMPFVVEGSSVVDAWLGLGIESRFDFQVGMKNILDSTLYGAAPVPRSLFAQLKWYYLN